MKKLLIFLLICLIMPLALAIETTLQYTYHPGQTLIIQISGNFIDNLLSNNIQLYSGNLFIPVVSDLAKINEVYWYYCQLPNKERNYTLLIKNAHYYDLGQEYNQDVEFNFSVSGNLTLFSVNPGFIVSNKNFSIDVESKLRNLLVKSDFSGSIQEKTVKLGQPETFKFSPSTSSNSTKITFSSESSSYEVPVYNFQAATTPSQSIIFTNSKINFTMIKDLEFFSKAYLLNNGKDDIENIALSTDLSELKIAPEKIKLLKAGSFIEINLTAKSSQEVSKTGYLMASSGNITAELPVSILAISNISQYIIIVGNNSSVVEDKTCVELGGSFCEEGFVCSSSDAVKLSSEGKYCCLAECEAISSGGWSTTKIITLVIILVVLIGFGYFLYRKSKLKKQTSKDIIHERAKELEERFKSKEVKGSLSKT